MPDQIRTSWRRLRRHRRAIGAGAIGVIAASPAGAADRSAPGLHGFYELALNAHRGIAHHEIIALILIAGVALFAVTTAIMLVRTRRQAAKLEAWTQRETAILRAAMDRARAILLSEPQLVVDWAAGYDEPVIEGDPATIGLSGSQHLLAFDSWLESGKAAAMERAVAALSARGEPFAMTLLTLGGYPLAVEAKSATEAVDQRLELLDSAARASIVQARLARGSYSGRLRTAMGGVQRTFDVLDFDTEAGSAGIVVDATEAETMRSALTRLADAHRRTLDQLSTGVAMFDSGQRLTFYNDAYRTLWDLDAAVLDQRPSDSAVLDILRAGRKLPEERDFRQWKWQLHEAYRIAEPKDHTWHLPDGRTLRVITTPNPEGGVTYLFHDVTERLDLERRFEELIRIQGETLDRLAEGVAVFGSDGRLRLHNAAFERMWWLPSELLADRPHIEKITALCQPLHGDAPAWRALRQVVTAIEAREATLGRIERRDGSVIDCNSVPLPDGATLATFHDVSDSVNVERALRERNEALEDADKIKVDFVHHVSYELRSPLTNIIGFVHLLGEPATGPLTQKQREYLEYITVSTNTLLALINNILDLATIDAGRMQLDFVTVDIREAMRTAAEGVQDRVVSGGVTLDIKAPPNIGSFVADKLRLRQILFNLLVNALSFSPPGSTVTLLAERRPDAIVFSVTDMGPGIPADMLKKVFDWFETHSLGSQHHGPGIGLSLVRSFVELHGGEVTIDSAVGQGTTVTCIFPLAEIASLTAAE